MGSYLNPGSGKFKTSLNSKIYIDKSELIMHLNDIFSTEQKFVCISRPRRFGKSMAANMLASYYGGGEDSSSQFDNLKIAKCASYREHQNKHNVIMLNIQEFLSSTDSMEAMLKMLKEYVIYDIKEENPDVKFRDLSNFIQVLKDMYQSTKRSFVILIDEWDCIFREYEQDFEAQKKYLDFLRLWLKDQEYVGLAYMTGILPIKKYGTHSALNMFTEYSMTNPGPLAPYFGFTEDEVAGLCEKYEMNYEETRAWYDGYVMTLERIPVARKIFIYSPKSVVEAMLHKSFQPYWNSTETYEALLKYIRMNFEGLKDDIVAMLAGGRVKINTMKFKNDMTSFSNKDDVMTLLVHLGYLTFDIETQEAYIPNKEVSLEYINAIEDTAWSEVIKSIQDSQKLLESAWACDGAAVAAGIDAAHREVSILQYNDENALSYTISLAFYVARDYYTIIRELPTGKGYADICYIPRRLYADKPALLVELKKDNSAGGAIAQIKDRNYIDALKEYNGNLLLIGINYDSTKKEHSCEIEQMKM